MSPFASVPTNVLTDLPGAGMPSKTKKRPTRSSWVHHDDDDPFGLNSLAPRPTPVAVPSEDAKTDVLVEIDGDDDVAKLGGPLADWDLLEKEARSLAVELSATKTKKTPLSRLLFSSSLDKYSPANQSDDGSPLLLTDDKEGVAAARRDFLVASSPESSPVRSLRFGQEEQENEEPSLGRDVQTLMVSVSPRKKVLGPSNVVAAAATSIGVTTTTTTMTMTTTTTTAKSPKGLKQQQKANLLSERDSAGRPSCTPHRPRPELGRRPLNAGHTTGDALTTVRAKLGAPLATPGRNESKIVSKPIAAASKVQRPGSVRTLPSKMTPATSLGGRTPTPRRPLVDTPRPSAPSWKPPLADTPRPEAGKMSKRRSLLPSPAVSNKTTMVFGQRQRGPEMKVRPFLPSQSASNPQRPPSAVRRSTAVSYVTPARTAPSSAGTTTSRLGQSVPHNVRRRSGIPNPLLRK